MNPRQRFGLLLAVLACIGALGVFVAISRTVSDVKSEVGPLVPVLALKQNVAAYRPISPADVQTVYLPQRWASGTTVHDHSQLVGKVAATNLTAGSYVQSDMLADQPALQPGEREIAILIDAETGVAGQIQPGSRVDIIATFAATSTSPATSRIIVAGARTLDVGQTATVQSSSQQGTTSQVVPITFALQPLDVQRVAYAESFATKVRLDIVAPNSTTAISNRDRTYKLQTDKGGTS